MYLGNVAQKQDAGATALGSLGAPVQTAMPIGTVCMLVVSTNALSTQDGSFTATDNATGGGAANTWTERGHSFKSGTCQLSVLTCTLTRALTTSNTVTAAHAAANVLFWNISIEAYDDLTAFDVEADATGASVNPASGPTAAGAQNNELVLCATACGATPTITHPGGWTDSGQTVAAGASTRNQLVQWQYVTTGGTRSGVASLSASASWCSITVVMKSAAPPQILVPISDDTTTGWVQTGGTGGAFWSCVNSGATPNDATFLTSPANPTSQPLKFLLSVGSAPTDLTGHKFHVRARLNGATGSLLLRIYSGATIIGTVTGVALTAGAIVWVEFDLSSVQAGNISPYSTIHGYLEATAA